MSKSQISVQCYPINTDMLHSIPYIYSKAMPTQEALDWALVMIRGLSAHEAFTSIPRDEGVMYIRCNDIKTILVKEADANY